MARASVLDNKLLLSYSYLNICDKQLSLRNMKNKLQNNKFSIRFVETKWLTMQKNLFSSFENS